jgi:NADH-quinone oxidoreductase subunit G
MRSIPARLAGRFPLASEIARALKAAKKPLVISGASCASEAVMEAAANVAMAANAALSFTAPECNTVGAALFGGRPLSAAFQAVRDGQADTVIILENDLYRRAPAAEVDAFLKAAAHVIVLDHLANPTTEKLNWFSPPEPSPNPTALSSAAKDAPSDSSRYSFHRMKCRQVGVG